LGPICGESENLSLLLLLLLLLLLFAIVRLFAPEEEEEEEEEETESIICLLYSEYLGLFAFADLENGPKVSIMFF
jgi:hypothetical protein